MSCDTLVCLAAGDAAERMKAMQGIVAGTWTSLSAKIQDYRSLKRHQFG